MLSKAFPAGLALATVLVTGTVAFADAPRLVRLEYERQEGATACPEDAAIRAGVAARLGYEPFRERAADRLRATIRQVAHGLEARIELSDAQGNLKAARRLTSRNRDCSELASSVELAIAIAIDPMGSAPRAGPSATEGVGPRDTSAQAPSGSSPAPPGAAAPPGSLPLASRAEVGLVGGWGTAPALGMGFFVGGALESDWWSLGIEARADLPSSTSLQTGQASAWMAAVSVAPCLRFGMASVCALGTGGARQVAGDGLIDSRHATLAYFAFGGRLAVALPVSKRAALLLRGDVTAPVTKTKLTVDDQVVWISPAVAVALGLGVAIVFP